MRSSSSAALRRAFALATPANMDAWEKIVLSTEAVNLRTAALQLFPADGAAAFHRDLVGHVFHLDRIHAFDHGGADHRRGQAVNGDAGFGEFLAHAFHQADHTRFR